MAAIIALALAGRDLSDQVECASLPKTWEPIARSDTGAKWRYRQTKETQHDAILTMSRRAAGPKDQTYTGRYSFAVPLVVQSVDDFGNTVYPPVKDIVRAEVSFIAPTRATNCEMADIQGVLASLIGSTTFANHITNDDGPL
jgi:hypothetical protein